jgi:hypothetical protein
VCLPEFVYGRSVDIRGDEMTEMHVDLLEWLRREFMAEQNSGFARLKRIPDTRVIRFLDHFCDLDVEKQSALMAILVEWSSHNLIGTLPNPIYEKFVEANSFLKHVGGLRYTGVSLLSGLANECTFGGLPAYFQARGSTGVALELPTDLVRNFADLVPVKPARLRRLVNSAFAELFAPRVTDIGSEIWRYEGTLEAALVTLHIRFSGRIGRPQLTYNATVRSKGRALVSPNLCFESILGVGLGHWDFITEENAERSVSLLTEFIAWLARLPATL